MPPSPRSTVGGGGLYNGSYSAYTGWPGYPFNGSNKYFRTRQVRQGRASVTGCVCIAPR